MVGHGGISNGNPLRRYIAMKIMAPLETKVVVYFSQLRELKWYSAHVSDINKTECFILRVNHELKSRILYASIQQCLHGRSGTDKRILTLKWREAF
jgi:hypothetical protein